MYTVFCRLWKEINMLVNTRDNAGRKCKKLVASREKNSMGCGTGEGETQFSHYLFSLDNFLIEIF